MKKQMTWLTMLKMNITQPIYIQGQLINVDDDDDCELISR